MRLLCIVALTLVVVLLASTGVDAKKKVDKKDKPTESPTPEKKAPKTDKTTTKPSKESVKPHKAEKVHKEKSHKVAKEEKAPKAPKEVKVEEKKVQVEVDVPAAQEPQKITVTIPTQAPKEQKPPKVPKVPKPVPKLQELKESPEGQTVFVPDVARVKLVKTKAHKTGANAKAPCGCSCGCPHCQAAANPPTTCSQSTSNTTGESADAPAEKSAADLMTEALTSDPEYVYMKLVPIDTLPEEGSADAATPIVAVRRTCPERAVGCVGAPKPAEPKAEEEQVVLKKEIVKDETLMEHAVRDIKDAVKATDTKTDAATEGQVDNEA